MRSKTFSSTVKAVFATFLTFLLAATLTAQPAQAKTKFKVLHTFHGNDGGFPEGVLVMDAAGNLYGTTAGGGTGTCTGLGCGAVFEMDKAGKEIWLHSFNGQNGLQPMAGVLRDAAGNLFGTTVAGGDIKNCNPPYGCGTVFKLDEAGNKERMLHKFTGNSDGILPEALLVADKAGNLYGTAYVGGANGVGVVFKVSTSGKEKILYTFTGGSDGCAPYPGVILDSAGNLYGVTSQGGDAFCNSGHGVVFRVDTAGNETVLHAFGGGDGYDPGSALIFDSSGNLYGTTAHGGNSQCGGIGCGVVFELTPQSGGRWSETVLYSFCSLSNCTDGAEPLYGPLVRDEAGNLYGTTYSGGTHQNCNGDACGVVFKLESTGKETVLHSFTGGTDGSGPFAGLVINSRGNLYGTTQTGGVRCYTSYTCGVVFKVTP